MSKTIVYEAIFMVWRLRIWKLFRWHIKMPKVSIIIVSFNVRSYLVSAIDSILKSNYSNYEIIVVDNNSYDNTVDIVSDKYPKVNIISNDENVGFGKAVNQGAKIASGDYFLILNLIQLLKRT